MLPNNQIFSALFNSRGLVLNCSSCSDGWGSTLLAQV